MTPLFLFLAISVLQSSEAMLEDAANKTNESVKKPRTKKKYIKAAGLKVRKDLLVDQDPGILAALFINLHSSTNIETPKKKGKRQLSNLREIYDTLTQKVGDKKKAKEALMGTADDFSDEENHLSAIWNAETEESVAYPTTTGFLIKETSSVWKAHVYEEIKNKTKISEKYCNFITEEEQTLSDLQNKIVELQREAEERRSAIKNLNSTKAHYQKKLEAAEQYSQNLIDFLSNQIDDISAAIENCDNDLQRLKDRANKLRNDENAVQDFNEQISKNKNEQNELIKEKETLIERKKRVIAGFDHVNEYLPKAYTPGSFGRQYVWGKNY